MRTPEAVRERLGGLTGAGVRVGHLDTGVDVSHPALESSVVERRHFARDGFSSVNDERGDTAAHGTYTAGVLAGNDPAHGFAGVAPGAELLCGTVIEGGEVVARIVSGLDWLLGRGVRVACLPLGVPPSPVLEVVVRLARELGLLVVAPIGNGGAGRFVHPGGCTHALSVGAGDGVQVSAFSGSRNDSQGRCLAPAVVAPGHACEGPVPGGAYESRNGTSAAAAVLTGVVALMLEGVPEATPSDIVEALCATAAPPESAQSHRCVSGFIDPAGAVRRLASARATSRPVPPATGTTWALPPAKGDARLKAALARGELSTAITVFRDRDARDRAVAGLGQAARVSCLELLPVAVVRAYPDLHRCFLDADGVVTAGATDVDRTWGLPIETLGPAATREAHW